MGADLAGHGGLQAGSGRGKKFGEGQRQRPPTCFLSGGMHSRENRFFPGTLFRSVGSGLEPGRMLPRPHPEDLVEPVGAIHPFRDRQRNHT